MASNRLLSPSEKRYNALRACLFFSLALLAFTAPNLLASPVQASSSGDTGNRYHLCFTATDQYNQSTKKCLYVTVVGACTLSTADVNIDGHVDILDLAMVADHFGENRTRPQPYNPLDSPRIGIEDLVCVASYFNQPDPLP